MQIGLDSLIDDELAAYVEESRNVNATLDASVGAQPQPDPSTPKGLQEARARLSVRPAQPGRRPSSGSLRPPDDGCR